MFIPPDFLALIERLNHEILETEQEVNQGLQLIRPLLERFPNNLRLIQFFSLLNNVLLFVEISRRRIRETNDIVSLTDISKVEIQEIGENLGTLLGKLIEAKIEVSQVILILESLI